MRTYLRSLALVSCLALTVPTLAACHAPVTIQTPQGRAAYTADQVVLRINRLQNTAIQAEATGGLPTATTKVIVSFAVSADTILKTAPNGWEASVLTLWTEAKKQIPPVSNVAVQAALDAVDLILAAL